jgi:hypothetical protein
VRSRSRRAICLALATALAALPFLTAFTAPAHAQLPLPPLNPCDLPGSDVVCDVVGDLGKDVLVSAGDAIMRGVTTWVTNAAVWVTGKVGELIEATASPDVGAAWFLGQYRSMLAVAAALALPMLLLSVIQAVWRQDVWILIRSALGYLPMAFILAGVAIVATDLLIAITDDLSQRVAEGVGGKADNLLDSVGQAYRQAIEDSSSDAVPLFGIFLGAIILAIGAFVLWLEMVIRDAAIYIAVFFLPLTFIAMIWPATSRFARRLVELLVAVILAKFVIVAIISLASAAITNANVNAVASGDQGQLFERMMAGAALLVLAAWSPFALLRLIPMMETAAAGVLSQRSSMSGAAQSAGISSPATYMRQAMDRHSRAAASTAYGGRPGTAYVLAGAPPDGEGSAPSQMRGAAASENRSGRATGGRSAVAYGERPRAAGQPSPQERPPNAPPLRPPEHSPPERRTDRPPPEKD